MPRPLAADHDQKRAAILDAATRLIAEHGMDGASISMIATAAGGSKAGLYHYYDSKEALVEDLLVGFLDDLLVAARPHPELASDAALHHLVVGVLRVCAARPGSGALVESRMRLSASGRRRVQSRQRRFAVAVEDTLVASCPGLEQQADARHAAVQSLFALLHWQHRWWHPGGAITIDGLGRQVVDLLLGGLPRTLTP